MSIAIAILITLSFQSVASDTEKMPKFVGDWEGTLMNEKDTVGIAARIIGLGSDKYRIQLLPEFYKRAALLLEIDSEFKNEKLIFSTDEWSGEMSGNSISGTRKTEKYGLQTFNLKKVEKYSPTLGLAAPKAAVVLFDGTNFDEWIHPGTPDRKPVWRLVNGAMESIPGTKLNGKRQKNDMVTKRSFTNFELHIEFKLPYCPDKRGQGRCNSGVFLQNFYEVQILDSYGLDGLWNECGALYKMAPPKTNMCAPPEQWQTYDIVYHAPRFNEDGEIIENAVATVSHNGKVIHYQTEFVHPTANTEKGRKTNKAPQKAAPIKLQDHNNPIQYRNIWIKEIDYN